MGIRKSFKPTNLVVNGNFSNGIAGWNKGTNDSGRLKYKATSQYDGPATSGIGTIVGHKYYMTATVQGATSIYFILLTIGTSKVNVTTPDTPQKLSNIFTATGTTHQLSIAEQAASGWADYWVDNVMMVDLTALFGAGAEPSVAWCDVNMPNYFGILSIKRLGGGGGMR